MGADIIVPYVRYVPLFGPGFMHALNHVLKDGDRQRHWDGEHRQAQVCTVPTYS